MLVFFCEFLANKNVRLKNQNHHLQILFFQVERQIMKKSVHVAQKVKVCSVERRPAEVDNTFLYASD